VVHSRTARLFALTALTIVTICFVITRTRLGASNLDVAAWGVTFDLTLTIPLVYYLTVVRTGAARAVTLAPVFVGCMMLAAFVVPRGQQQFLHDLRFVSVPLEIVTIILIAKRLVRVRDVETATRELFGDTRLAAFVAAEVGILWYALFCWRKKPQESGFTVHERSGWVSIVACILTLLIAESIGMHLLVQMWSPIAAWVVTSLDLYGMLWLIGDYHALRLRPSFAENGVLHVRHGLRWSAEIALDNIDSVDDIREESEWKRKGVLKLAMLDEPRILVRLREPVVAHGLAGFRRTIDAVAVLPDDLDAFHRTIR